MLKIYESLMAHIFNTRVSYISYTGYFQVYFKIMFANFFIYSAKLNARYNFPLTIFENFSKIDC